jgi:hypothetical protein
MSDAGASIADAGLPEQRASQSRWICSGEVACICLEATHSGTQSAEGASAPASLVATGSAGKVGSPFGAGAGSAGLLCSPPHANPRVARSRMLLMARVYPSHVPTLKIGRFRIGILRTKDEEGEWNDDFVAFGKDKETRDLSAGEEFATNFIGSDVEIAKHLRKHDWNPNDAVGSDSVKLIIKCIADVKGSPFDPDV